MGHPQVRPLFTRQEYYSMEKMANLRHEYWCGEISMMAGGSPTHALLIGRMTTLLNNELAGSSCDAVPSDQRVRIESEDLDTYPDVVVLCEDALFDPLDAHTLIEPKILVEVLSPSTAEYDRTTKLEAYKQIPTLTDYFVVWQDRICIEHHTCEGEDWQMRCYEGRADVLPVSSLNIELPLAEVYRRLDLPEGAGN